MGGMRQLERLSEVVILIGAILAMICYAIGAVLAVLGGRFELFWLAFIGAGATIGLVIIFRWWMRWR